MTSLAAFLQAPEPETKPVVGGLTILDLLREGKMEAGGSVSRIRQRKSFTQRLGLKGMSCCGGPIWGFQADTISIVDDDEVEGDVFVSRGGGGGGHEIRRPLTQDENVAVEQEEQVCAAELPASASSSSMNLAAALAAERQYRATQEPETVSEEGTPLRVSLMRLLEEGDGWPGEAEAAEGSDGDVCCVCMGRKKGAAFIPCGHTYCRVCSRELWLNRGSCPLCNRRIIEILDIF